LLELCFRIDVQFEIIKDMFEMTGASGLECPYASHWLAGLADK